MLTDPREQHIAAAFKAARPVPRAGWEARAMAAIADIRPRRHPNLLTYIIIAALLLLLAAGVLAAVGFFLGAQLQFSEVIPYPDAEGDEVTLLVSYIVGRDLHLESAGPPTVERRGHKRLSPDGTRQAFQRGNVGLGWSMHRCDVYLADADGSNERNVTQPAGLGGVNCRPMWSPDGTMIYFAHVDPVEGKTPCQSHFEMWLMQADGSEPHRLTPPGSPTLFPGQVCWSPDSARLLSCWMTDVYEHDSRLVTAFTVDVRTDRMQVLPNVGLWPKYSPDGSKIASLRRVPDTAEGEWGDWGQLLVTNADGSGPRVLVEQFISDAAARASPRVMNEVLQHHDGYDWVNDFWYLVGPRRAAWSPGGTQIAFLAALPYDPSNPSLNDQTEVWVYDLDTDKAVRVTHDNVEQVAVSWE